MRNPPLYRLARPGAVRRRAKGFLWSRSVELRASGCVGSLAGGFALFRSFGIDRLADLGHRGGARVGRPRWLRILMITGGSSIAAMIFKAPPQLGQCSMSMSKTRLSSRPQLVRGVSH